MRWIIRLALVVVLLCAGAYLLRRQAAEVFLARQLGVPVSLERLDIGPGGVLVQGLSIGVPRAGQLERSLDLASLRIDYSLQGLRQDPPVWKRFELEGLRVGVEVYDQETSNWSLMAEPPALGDLPYRIKEFALRDVRISIVNGWGKAERLDFSPDQDIELKDIGGGKRLPIEKLLAPFFRGYNEAADQLARSQQAE